MGMFSGIGAILGDIFLPGIGSAIGSLAGGMLDSEQASEGVRDQNNANAQQAALTNQFNAEQAELNRSFQSDQSSISRGFNSEEASKARDWSEKMSGSSYQRAMADMARAGLNPMLAASHGGASTPGAASASAGAPSGSSASGISARMENAKGAGLEQSIQLKRLSNETSVAESQAALNRASANKMAAETVNVPTTGANIEASTRKINEEIREVSERANLAREHAISETDKRNLMRAQEALAGVEKWLKGGQITLVDAETAVKKIEAYLMQLSTQGARNEAESQETWWKRNVTPFLPDLLKGASGAGSIRGLTR